MNHYIHFTFECFSKFINYISQDFIPETEDDIPIISKEMAIYICNHLLFFRNIQKLVSDNSEIKYTFEKANTKIVSMLLPSLQKYNTILSTEAYDEIIFTDPTNEFKRLLMLYRPPPYKETNQLSEHFLTFDDTNDLQKMTEAHDHITKQLDMAKSKVFSLDAEIASVIAKNMVQN
jgi:hypothetical protein